MPDQYYKCTLAKFTTPDSGTGGPDIANMKYVPRESLSLQGDTTGGGTWATIPSDEYEVRQLYGQIVQRSVDDDGNAVDWSSYQAYRATYYIHDITATDTRTLVSNETQTFADDDTGFSPIGPEGQVNLDFGQYIIGAFIRAARALSMGVKRVDPSGYADTTHIELDHEMCGTVYATGAVAGGYTIVSIKRGDDGQILTYINSMSDNCTLESNHASVSAGYANIATHTGADVSTGTAGNGNGSFILQYIADDDQWYVLNAWG